MTPVPATKLSRPPRNLFTEPVVSIILSILLTIVLRPLAEKAWPYLTSLWHLGWFRTVAAIVLSLGGGALFLFKKRFQTIYGWSEICFAVFVIGAGIERVQTAGDAASWSAMVGGVYLIVRGLTNCDEGLKKRRNA